MNRELYWIFFLALPISMLRQINLVSGDAPEEAADGAGYPVRPDGAYGYASSTADKPWLRPVAAQNNARLGAAVLTGDTGNLAHVGRSTKSDINLGKGQVKEQAIEADFDLADYDMTISGDHTLDTTRIEVDDMDGTLESSYQSDYDDTQPVVRPVELFQPEHEYEHEHEHEQEGQLESSEHRYSMNDTDIGGDRYDKKFGDSEGEWLDIPLGDK